MTQQQPNYSQYSDAQVIALFGQHVITRMTQTAFAAQYGINGGNLSSYLRHRRSSPASKIAIVSWLHQHNLLPPTPAATAAAPTPVVSTPVVPTPVVPTPVVPTPAATVATVAAPPRSTQQSVSRSSQTATSHASIVVTSRGNETPKFSPLAQYVDGSTINNCNAFIKYAVYKLHEMTLAELVAMLQKCNGGMSYADIEEKLRKLWGVSISDRLALKKLNVSIILLEETDTVISASGLELRGGQIANHTISTMPVGNGKLKAFITRRVPKNDVIIVRPTRVATY